MCAARKAFALIDKVREDDPNGVFEELRLLAELHPAKYAQVAMVLAAFVDPGEGTAALLRRADAIADSRIARHLSVVAS
ncbi:hypothetical protein BKG78_23645 [Mycobacteroides chelonae]|nr:hypothetical protein BKG78_23645 [Mycobacteroides chelonae]